MQLMMPTPTKALRQARRQRQPGMDLLGQFHDANRTVRAGDYKAAGAKLDIGRRRFQHMRGDLLAGLVRGADHAERGAVAGGGERARPGMAEHDWPFHADADERLMDERGLSSGRGIRRALPAGQLGSQPGATDPASATGSRAAVLVILGR